MVKICNLLWKALNFITLKDFYQFELNKPLFFWSKENAFLFNTTQTSDWQAMIRTMINFSYVKRPS